MAQLFFSPGTAGNYAFAVGGTSNSFDSDTELFMYRTYCINYHNIFCKQFDRNEPFWPFDLSSAGIKNGI